MLDGIISGNGFNVQTLHTPTTRVQGACVFTRKAASATTFIFCFEGFSGCTLSLENLVDYVLLFHLIIRSIIFRSTTGVSIEKVALFPENVTRYEYIDVLHVHISWDKKYVF